MPTTNDTTLSKDTTLYVPRLCYIEGQIAYFTTRPLAEQWGDDWNDAPYEHNAGLPYTDREGGHEIYRVLWDADLETPADRAGMNSNYSVEGINAGLAPWLATPRDSDKGPCCIPGGATLAQFVAMVAKHGGSTMLIPNLEGGAK